MHVRSIAALLLSLMFGACGVHTSHAPDGTSVSEVFFGLGSSVSCGETQGVTASVTTLGAWTGESAGLGYHQARFFCGSPKCQVVIWPESPADAEALRKAYGDFGNVCVVETGR